MEGEREEAVTGTKTAWICEAARYLVGTRRFPVVMIVNFKKVEVL